MDRKEDVEAIRKQLREALEKNGGSREGSEELKNMLEALEVLEEQPEIKEAWTAEDERLFQSRDNPRVTHKPTYHSNSSKSESTLKAEQPNQPPTTQLPTKIVKETVEWKGIKEKNFVEKKR